MRPLLPVRRVREALLAGVAGLLASLVVPVAPAVAAAAHPQDGAHADVRIFVAETEVRMEIGMNLAFLDETLGLAREREDALDPVEESILEEAAVEMLTEENRVVIDGIEVRPIVRDFAFQYPDPTLLPLFPRTGMRGLIRCAASLSYPLAGEPEEVAITWSRFPTDALSAELEGGLAPLVLQAQLSAEGRVELIDFSVADPTHTWRASHLGPADRMEPVPLPPRLATAGGDGATAIARRLVAGDRRPVLFVTLGFVLAALLVAAAGRRADGVLRRLGLSLFTAMLLLAGAGTMILGLRGTEAPSADAGDGAAALATASGLPDAEQAARAFAPLHANLYRAFEYTAEGDIYDALALSVDGEILRSLYDRVYRSLIMADHDQAVGRVTDVELLSTEVPEIGRDDAGRARFEVAARWTVEGTVYHWGHAHSRIHEFEARYEVTALERGWRITGQRVLSQRRIPNPTDPLDADPSLPDGLVPRGIEF